MRRIRDIIRAAGTVWCLVGVCLMAVLAVDLILRAVFFVKDTWIDGPTGNYATKWATDFWSEYSILGTERRSYVEWRRKPFEGSHINIDSCGIRRTWSKPDLAVAESSRPFRIFVFGGSTVWGTGARDEATIPSFLAKQLVAKGLPVDVVNMGETGYVTTQELVTLLLRLQRGDIPDCVVFYDGINDAFSAFQRRAAGLPQDVTVGHVQLKLNLYFGNFTGDFVGFDRVVQGLNRRISRRVSGVYEESVPAVDEEEIVGDTVRIYERNLMLIQSLGEAYGFESYFFWQPVVFTKLQPTEFEARVAGDMRKFRSYCLAVYDRVAKSESLAQNSRFHDISSILDQLTDQCYLDFAHVTEEANDRIAKEMVTYLAPEIERRIAQGLSRSTSDKDRLPTEATVAQVPELHPTED